MRIPSAAWRVIVATALTLPVLAAAGSVAAQLHPRAALQKPINTILAPHDERHIICVMFKEGLTIRLRDGRLSDQGTGALAPAPVSAALSAVAAGRWIRSHQLDEQRLDQLRQSAQANLGRAVADLNLDFRLVLPPGVDAAATIDMFNALECVELALPVPKPCPPPEFPTPPDFQPNQVYLNAAPDGVDALGTWRSCLLAGEGITIIDAEYEWNLNHQDLPPVALVGADPVPPGFGTNHGTAVLGILGSKNNNWGTTGIAHGAQLKVVATNTAAGYNVANAITAAAAVLQPGDILLIEQQVNGVGPTGNYVPVEWYVPNYNAIVAAVGNGIIVIEAAGNGSQNLDSGLYSTGNNGHWPFLPQNDSGAIIVGAGAAPKPLGSDVDRSRLPYSTYGSTVDLQGWGEDIWTTGFGNAYSAEGPNYWYTFNFGGTSGAAAMVAAAAALVQAVHKSDSGFVLTPTQMRDTLALFGSPQQDGSFPVTQNIGSRPNVTAVLNSCAGFEPPCPPDIDGDDTVGVADLLAVISSWGPCPLPCAADIAPSGGDGTVDINDLLAVISAWGPCP
ncbi:MAG: S8 family serine peptidase [Phycisphaerales bacterium]|nr:S8 family serine peptidase [Phycisphaerales bacterium]